MKRLGRLLTAMITPFDERGAVDVDEAVRLAQWLVERRNDGVVVSGTTGESPALETGEKLALFRAIKAGLGERGTVVAGTGGNNTHHSVELTKQAEQCGVDGILAVVPYYNKPTQDGMLTHFGAICEATSLPVIIYNIPGRTGANMLPATFHELCRRNANVAGIKESTGDINQFTAVLRGRVRDDVTFWSGDDHMYLPSLAVGGFGCISVAGHIVSREMQQMAEAFDAGNVATAARLYQDLAPVIGALFATTSPIPVKWAMNEFGFHAGACRSPLGVMPDEVAMMLRPLIDRYRPG